MYFQEPLMNLVQKGWEVQRILGNRWQSQNVSLVSSETRLRRQSRSERLISCDDWLYNHFASQSSHCFLSVFPYLSMFSASHILKILYVTSAITTIFPFPLRSKLYPVFSTFHQKSYFHWHTTVWIHVLSFWGKRYPNNWVYLKQIFAAPCPL